MPFLFKRIVRFRGAMLLIVPLNLNSTWILILAFPGGSLSLPVCAFSDSCQTDPGISSSASFFTFLPRLFWELGALHLRFVSVIRSQFRIRLVPLVFPQLALIFLLKGLSPPKRSRVTQVSLGDFDCYWRFSFFSGFCWSISRTNLCFLLSISSQVSCF